MLVLLALKCFDGEIVPPFVDVCDEEQYGAAWDRAHGNGFVEELEGSSCQGAGFDVACKGKFAAVLLGFFG